MKSKDQRLEELERENRLLKTIIDNIHEGVYATSERGEIILYNCEVEKAEGCRREDMLGKMEEEVYSSAGENNFFIQVTKNVKKTGQPLMDKHIKFSLPNGRKTDLIINSFPFYDNGQLAAIYSIGYDINRINKFIIKTVELSKKLALAKNCCETGAKYLLEDIIGNSAKIREVILLARKIADHNSNVLLIGETGTGKELFAHGIHNSSLFANGPFVPVNCAAIPDTLLESILFGTVKGAFTGAIEMSGFFEQAENGTIFLDEINSMPLSLQAKLLRVIQEKVVRRVGSKTEIPINCRIISATNIDPYGTGKHDTIRPDLFFRLAAVTIKIPSLNERKEDIGILSAHFVKKYNVKLGLLINNISPELIKIFEQYQWPGNIRELENVIESAMHFAEINDKILSEKHLPVYFREKLLNSRSILQSSTNTTTLNIALLEYEKQIINDSLRKNQGNITKSAQDLGILRQNLHYRIRRFGIKANTN